MYHVFIDVSIYIDIFASWVKSTKRYNVSWCMNMCYVILKYNI